MGEVMETLIEKLRSAVMTGSGQNRYIREDDLEDIIRQHGADLTMHDICGQITNERMCIMGRWWVPVDNYQQANMAPAISGDGHQSTASPANSCEASLYKEFEEYKKANCCVDYLQECISNGTVVNPTKQKPVSLEKIYEIYVDAYADVVQEAETVNDAEIHGLKAVLQYIGRGYVD